MKVRSFGALMCSGKVVVSCMLHNGADEFWRSSGSMVNSGLQQNFYFVCPVFRICIGSLYFDFDRIVDRCICIDFLLCWVKIRNYWACPIVGFF